MRSTRLIFLLVCALPALSRAQTTLYWDTDGATPGLAQGDGTWNLSTMHWSTSASGDVATQGWTDGAIARFENSSQPGPVLGFDSNLTIGGILVHSGNSSVAVNGSGIMTLSSGAELNVQTVGHLDLNVVVAGTTTPGQIAFTKTGQYELNLTAANTYTGQTVVTDGDINVFGNGAALGASGAGNETILSTGFFPGIRFNSTVTTNESFVVSTFSILGVNPDTQDFVPRTVTLTGPILLQAQGWLHGENFYAATLTSTGVISESSGPRDLRVHDVTLSGANIFTGKVMVDGGRLSVPVFNDAGTPGPLGSGTGLQLGFENEGVSDGEVEYTGPTASSNRTVQLLGDGTITVSNPASALTLTGVISRDALGVSVTDLTKSGPGTLVLQGNNTFNGETFLTNGTLVAGHDHALGVSFVEVGTEETASSDNLSLLLAPGVTLMLPVDIYNENPSGTTTLGMSAAGLAEFFGEIYMERNVAVNVPTGGTLHFTGFLNDGDDGGSLAKNGPGRAIISGDVELRGGGIDVDQGELTLLQTTTFPDGPHTSVIMVEGNTFVANGAKLSGDAIIVKNEGVGAYVIVAGGGVIGPGSAGSGKMTMDNLYLSSGGILQWQIASLTTSNTSSILLANDTSNTEIYPTANLAVDLSLIGISSRPNNANPALNDPFWQTPEVWLVVDFTNGSSQSNLLPGTANPIGVTNGVWLGGNFDTFIGGGAGAFSSFASGDLFLRFTPVPEPSTYALLGVGTMLLLLPRLRRRG